MSSSHTSTRTRVLSESAHRTLTELGEDIPFRGGWHIIRCVALSESSSSDSEASVEIPRVLESVEAMEFLGFTAESAAEIYDRFLEGSARIPEEEIIDYAKGHVRSGRDAGSVEDDWNSAMESMGIDQSLRDSILDPKFSEIRLTQNAMAWVLDTIEAKYIFLSSIDTNVLGPRHSNQGPVSLQSRLEQSKKSSRGSQSKSGKEASDKPQPQVRTSVAEHTLQANEFLLLKGGDLNRLKRAIRLETDATDTNRIQNVVSVAPGDFSGSEQGLYFSKQRQVAYDHASYAKARLRSQGEDIVAVGILNVVLPKEVVENAVELYGEDWKVFVWNHRLQRETPDHLKYVDEYSVIIGPILKCSQNTLEKLVKEKKDHKVLVSMKLSAGETATQHFLKGMAIVTQVNARGRFWVESLDGSK